MIVSIGSGDLQRRELREVGERVVGENADAIIAQIETR